MSSAKIYCGGIHVDATESEIESAFSKYGPLRSVWLARKPPGFAFIEFEDSRDAEAAIDKLDGSNGWRVELSRKSDRGPRGGGDRYGDRDRGGGDRYGDRDRGPRGGGGGGMRSDMKCYNCGEPGHFSRECPRGSRDGGGRGGDRDRGRESDRGYGGGGGGGGGSRYRSRSPPPRRRSPSYSPRPRRSPSYGKSASRSPKRD